MQGMPGINPGMPQEPWSCPVVEQGQRQGHPSKGFITERSTGEKMRQVTTRVSLWIEIYQSWECWGHSLPALSTAPSCRPLLSLTTQTPVTCLPKQI